MFLLIYYKSVNFFDVGVLKLHANLESRDIKKKTAKFSNSNII